MAEFFWLGATLGLLLEASTLQLIIVRAPLTFWQFIDCVEARPWWYKLGLAIYAVWWLLIPFSDDWWMCTVLIGVVGLMALGVAAITYKSQPTAAVYYAVMISAIGNIVAIAGNMLRLCG